MTNDKPKPAPLENEPGKQMDDNIDDLGRKQDGSKQQQPVNVKPSTRPMTERGADGRAHKTKDTEDGETVPKTGDDIPPNPSIVRSNPD